MSMGLIAASGSSSLAAVLKPVYRPSPQPQSRDEVGCLRFKPALEHLFRAALDHVQQRRRPDTVTHRGTGR